jgi:uncharacterized protein YlzI (FlbEa/FlbD family)
MFGTSRIELEKIEGIAIPNTAIIIMGDISYVFRNNSEDSFERIIIEPGIQSEEFTRVISGLSEGDKIVIQGANLFKGLSFGY